MINRLIFILFFLFIIGCSKDNESEQLPQLTTKGLGTFGCLVENNIWLPRKLEYSLFPSPQILSFSYIPKSGRLWINARREYDKSIKYEDVTLEIDSVFDEGKYFPKAVEWGYEGTYFTRVYDNITSTVYISRDSLIKDCEIVFLDTTKRIISGTFKISLLDTTTRGIINLTNGIFDLKY
jgi:hypothetical protein